jgi:phage protein D
LNNYSSQIITKLSGSDKWNKDENFKQNIRDFKFIYEYAKSREHEFFVLSEYIYLIKKGHLKSPITTLEWGENILSFSRSYSNAPIQVVGILKKDGQEVFRYTKDTKSPMDSAGVKMIEKHIDVTDAKNSDDVVCKVESYAANLEDLAAGGTVKCVGLPEIVPARFVKLDNLDKKLNNDYYITSVDHSFSGGGYTTSFSITREI